MKLYFGTIYLVEGWIGLRIGQVKTTPSTQNRIVLSRLLNTKFHEHFKLKQAGAKLGQTQEKFC